MAHTHWTAYEKLAEQLLVGSIRPFEVVTVLADNYSTPPQMQFEVYVREHMNRRLKLCAVATLARIDSRASDGLQIVDLLTSVVEFEFGKHPTSQVRGTRRSAGRLRA